MIATLEELTRYVRETVPQAKTISHLRPIEEADAVTFRWRGRDFVVKRSLEVLEMKGKKLYVTGASMLMQLVLTNKSRNEKVLETIVKTLAESEAAIMERHRTEDGLRLLEMAKASLARLAGKPAGHTTRASGGWAPLTRK